MEKNNSSLDFFLKKRSFLLLHVLSAAEFLFGAAKAQQLRRRS